MENQANQNPNEGIRKLGELMKGIKFCMLITVEEDGRLHARPMVTQQIEFDGDLWFFTNHSAPKCEELQRDRHVSVTFAAPENHRYVAVSGVATVVQDKDHARKLWNPLYKAWFPQGLDDPDLALLKVAVERAEYWDSPASTVQQIVGFAKAVATGKRYEPSKNEKLNLAG